MWIRLVLLCHTNANIKFKACRLKLGRNFELFLWDYDLWWCASFGVLTGRFGPLTPGRFGPAHTMWSTAMWSQVDDPRSINWCFHWMFSSISIFAACGRILNIKFSIWIKNKLCLIPRYVIDFIKMNLWLTDPNKVGHWPLTWTQVLRELKVDPV